MKKMHYDQDLGPYNGLIQSFRYCADLDIPAPHKIIPDHEAMSALTREMWVQTCAGMTALLYNHYDTPDKFLKNKCHIFDSARENATRCFRVSLAVSDNSHEEDLALQSVTRQFVENFDDAANNIQCVGFVQPFYPDFVAIAYEYNTLLQALGSMIENHHPQDAEALGHFNTARHVFHRIATYVPANRLC